MSDPASLLLRLLEQTDAVLRPGLVLGRRAEIAALREEVVEAKRMPCESSAERVIDDEAVLLAQVLELIEAAREVSDEKRVLRLCQVAGVLAPCIRGDAGAAIERRRNTIARADPPDYLHRKAAP